MRPSVLGRKNIFSRPAGIAAGIILALYAPAIFFEALIQKTVLDLFLISLFLFLLSRAQQKPHWSHWLGAGTVLGLLGLCRENALIWVLVVAVWSWLYFVEHPLQSRLHWTTIFLAGLVLILLPVGLRNLHVGGELTLTTSQLGPNFLSVTILTLPEFMRLCDRSMVMRNSRDKTPQNWLSRHLARICRLERFPVTLLVDARLGLYSASSL